MPLHVTLLVHRIELNVSEYIYENGPASFKPRFGSFIAMFVPSLYVPHISSFHWKDLEQKIMGNWDEHIQTIRGAVSN